MREKDVEGLLDLMPEGEKYYLTIEGIDLSIDPGMGTPSPGGLLYEEFNEFLRAISTHGTSSDST